MTKNHSNLNSIPAAGNKPPPHSDAPPPGPNPAEPKMAKDMTAAERKAFLDNHRKKFGC